MQQLNIFDFYDVQDKKDPPKQLQNEDQKPVKRRSALRKKPDLVISIDSAGRRDGNSPMTGDPNSFVRSRNQKEKKGGNS